MTLFCLRLRKSFWIEDCRTLSPKTMHCVCCFHWCRRVLSWTFVVWMEFVSLVSYILPPRHQFCAATYHRQLQTRHIGRWLTSVKFRSKVNVHWFNKLLGLIRTGRTLQARKWIEIYKCQWTITPHQRFIIGLASNKLTSLTSQFPYFLETLPTDTVFLTDCRVFEHQEGSRSSATSDMSCSYFKTKHLWPSSGAPLTVVLEAMRSRSAVKKWKANWSNLHIPCPTAQQTTSGQSGDIARHWNKTGQHPPAGQSSSSHNL